MVADFYARLWPWIDHTQPVKVMRDDGGVGASATPDLCFCFVGSKKELRVEFKILNAVVHNRHLDGGLMTKVQGWIVVAVLLVGFVFHVATALTKSQASTRREYRVMALPRDAAEFTQQMNVEGAKGWELVTMDLVNYSDTGWRYRAVVARPVQ